MEQDARKHGVADEDMRHAIVHRLHVSELPTDDDTERFSSSVLTTKPYGFSNGVPVTDEVIDRAATEAEAGYELDQITPRPTGPP